MASEWPPKAMPSVLTLTLQPVPEGTELTMVHSDVPIEQADDYELGWTEYYWDPMVRYFEKRHKPYGKGRKKKEKE
jgi:activator of HSP90 ATPase